MPCRAARIGALAVIGLLLAGCSSGDEPAASQSESAATTEAPEPSPEPSDEPTPSESEEPSESESESESEEPTESESAQASAPAASELTPPGTELALGEQAIVTDSLIDGSLIGLTVKSIEPGAIEDLAEFDLDAEERENTTPFYVSVTYENLGDVDLGSQGINSLKGYVGAAAYSPVIFFSSFERCQYESAPTELPQGASFESCLTFLVEDGPVEEVGWNSGPEGTEYFEDPVLWRP